MKQSRVFKTILAFLITTVPIFTSSASAAPATVKPLWSKGWYYGGYPTLDKYLTQGVIFNIAPDKVTLKELSIEFPADCYDENGVPSPRSIHFSAAEIEPLTLARNDRSQSLYFAYLDSFGLNWNTELRIKWSRNRQSFTLHINTQSDVVEGTYCKGSATLSNNAKKGRTPGL